MATEQVEVVANLLEELAARSGLSAALGAVSVRIVLTLPGAQHAARRCLHACFMWTTKDLLANGSPVLQSLSCNWQSFSIQAVLTVPGTCAGGRDAQSLLPLLTHLVKHLSDPRHSDLFIGITNRILDIYAPAVSPELTLSLSCAPQKAKAHFGEQQVHFVL